MRLDNIVLIVYRADFVDYGKHENVLQSPYVTLTYHYDVQGPVPPGPEHAVFNSLTAPQWGIDMVCNTATIEYGPWADRQRKLLHKFFQPSDYQVMSHYT